jgi:hypothetical protein
MEYITINGLKIQSYTVKCSISEHEIVGVYAKDRLLVHTFLDILSGIDKNHNTCFYQGKDLYDNLEYFRNRMYLDYMKNYLSTLKASYIEERMHYRFNKSFDKDTFVKIVRELNIRGETEISYTYRFTPAGNTLVNYALTKALEPVNIIICNPTAELRLEADNQAIAKGLTDRMEYGSVILGLDRLYPFAWRLNRILLFTDFGTAVILDGNQSLIVFKKEYFPIENKIFHGNFIIALNNFSREELKGFTKQKYEYQVISVYEMDQYLKENI